MSIAGAQDAGETTALEAESRRVAHFQEVEDQSPKRFAAGETGLMSRVTGLLGQHNPLSKPANPSDHILWLLDNTAYRPIHSYPHDQQPWQAEFVACFFHAGRKDITKFVAYVADQIGLDGKIGLEENSQIRHRIEERLQPFVSAITPARTIQVSIPCPDNPPHIRTLGPSGPNGISSQLIQTGGNDSADGKWITDTSYEGLFPQLSAQTRYAGPEEWGIVSDIDDTIKYTGTTDPKTVLQTTFADVPKATEGMKVFYHILDTQFKQPAWFYLSASPYNLYPFTHKFIGENYPRGTIILRDNSWQYFGGVLQSLTQGVQAYKVDRLKKIHSWLPKRKFICIGDSTQSDPEAYAELYKMHHDWIKAIYIRRVTDVPHMETKNSGARFQKAFEGVPGHIWKDFGQPDELADHLKHVAGQAHMGIVGALQGYFCAHERSVAHTAVDDGRLASHVPADDQGQR